jgi:hypothetical protein
MIASYTNLQYRLVALSENKERRIHHQPRDKAKSLFKPKPPYLDRSFINLKSNKPRSTTLNEG